MNYQISSFVSAVERLDYYAIDRLLNNQKLYCGVTKDKFLQVLSNVFQNIRNDINIADKLSAHKVKCQHFGRHRNPYIFIDSMKFGKITVDLDIDRNDLLSIEICYHPDCGDLDCYNFNSLIFFDDDKPNFVWTTDHILRKNQIDSLVNDFYEEYEKEGIIYSEFVLHWFRSSFQLAVYQEKQHNSFRYQEEIKKLASIVYPFFQLAAWSKEAKRISKELKSMYCQNEQIILKYLQKDENNFPYINYKALDDWQMKQGFTEYEGFKFFVFLLTDSRVTYFKICEYENDFLEKGIITTPLHRKRLVCI